MDLAARAARALNLLPSSLTRTTKSAVVLGSVVDFVDVYWRDYHFWAFNVADSAITAGVILMIADMLRSSTDVPATV